MRSAQSGFTARRSLLAAGFFILLALLSICVAFLSVRLMTEDGWAHDEAGGHHWIHEQLRLTDEEAAKIDVFEAPYRAERRELEARFEERIATLAELLQTEDVVSEEVTRAVHELHIVHGQLQQLAIEHYFEMLSVLPPEKQEKLRALAVEALSTPQ